MKKLLELKKVLSNLELEGQGRGIIMGVTFIPYRITDQKGPNILVVRASAKNHSTVTDC